MPEVRMTSDKVRPHDLSLCLLMKRMPAAESAILLELQTIGCGSFVLCRRIVPPSTFRTGQSHNVSHLNSTGSGDLGVVTIIR